MIPNGPQIHVVDDEPDVLKALSRLLRSAGFAVVTYSRPDTFLAACSPETRGCAVLDMAMPGLSGLEVQEQLAARGCGMPVLFLTGRGEVPTSVRAMKNGAQDFLSKPVDGPALIAAVREALARDLTGHEAAIELAAFRARMATLTPREHEVLGEVLTGKLNKQIAAVLGTAEKTVKVHRARVMDKLGIDSVAELARLAERAGLNG